MTKLIQCQRNLCASCSALLKSRLHPLHLAEASYGTRGIRTEPARNFNLVDESNNMTFNYAQHFRKISCCRMLVRQIRKFKRWTRRSAAADVGTYPYDHVQSECPCPGTISTCSDNPELPEIVSSYLKQRVVTPWPLHSCTLTDRTQCSSKS